MWVGELPAAGTVAALGAQGIGVIFARDAAHALKLLTHFQASAVVSAEVEHLLALPSATTPLILVGAPSRTDVAPAHALRVSEPTPQRLAAMITRLVRTHAEHPAAPS